MNLKRPWEGVTHVPTGLEPPPSTPQVDFLLVTLAADQKEFVLHFSLPRSGCLQVGNYPKTSSLGTRPFRRTVQYASSVDLLPVPERPLKGTDEQARTSRKKQVPAKKKRVSTKAWGSVVR